MLKDPTAHELQVAVSNPDNAGQVSEVAACLGRSSASGTPAALHPVNGNLFCCMPLPFSATGLPVHVNGSWRLQSNRRELWTNIDDERKLVRCMCFKCCGCCKPDSYVHSCD